MSDIREEFTNKLPFKVLHIDKTEIDDDIIIDNSGKTTRRKIYI